MASAQEFTLGQEKLLGGTFSPDGSMLAMKTATGVLLFDTDNLQPIQSLSTQGLSVYELAFSPDSRYLAWIEGRREVSVRVWELATFTQVAYFRLNAFGISALFFVPGRGLLAAQELEYFSISLHFPSTLHFWQVDTWEEHGSWVPPGKRPGVPGQISNLAFTPGGKQFTASTRYIFWDEGYEEGHKQFVVDVETLKPVASSKTQERILAYSPDGRFEAVLVDWDEDLLIRDPQQHKLIANLSENVADYLYFQSISPDSKWLATTTGEELILWNTQTWQIESRMKLSIAHGFVRGSYWYANLAPTGELRLWDLFKGELLTTSSERYDKTNGGIFDIDVTPDSKWIVARTNDKQVIIWDLETYDRVKTIQVDGTIPDVQFSSDGRRLVVFVPKEHSFAIAEIHWDGFNHNHKIILWDAEADKVIRETKRMPGEVSHLRVSRDGKFIASVASTFPPHRSVVHIWDVARLKEIASLPDHSGPVAFHPDNQWVACKGESSEVVLWDFEADEVKVQKDLEDSHFLRGMVFSPDGSHLAVFGGEERQVVRLLHTNSLEEKAIFEGHQREVTDVLFTPDGQYLITASLDAKVRGWRWRDAMADVQPMELKRFTWSMLKRAELLANYPNPANPETWIPFVLRESAEVEIRIYDVAGNPVRTMQLGQKSPGIYRSKERAAYWNGRNDAGEAVGSGIYYYEMRTGSYSFVRKAMLLK